MFDARRLQGRLRSAERVVEVVGPSKLRMTPCRPPQYSGAARETQSERSRAKTLYAPMEDFLVRAEERMQERKTDAWSR